MEADLCGFFSRRFVPWSFCHVKNATDRFSLAKIMKNQRRICHFFLSKSRDCAIFLRISARGREESTERAKGRKWEIVSLAVEKLLLKATHWKLLSCTRLRENQSGLPYLNCIQIISFAPWPLLHRIINKKYFFLNDLSPLPILFGKAFSPGSAQNSLSRVVHLGRRDNYLADCYLIRHWRKWERDEIMNGRKNWETDTNFH